jgi:hypothetical protein
MTIGVRHIREPERLALPRLLALPFVGETGSYPFGGASGKGVEFENK